MPLPSDLSVRWRPAPGSGQARFWHLGWAGGCVLTGRGSEGLGDFQEVRPLGSSFPSKLTL